MRVYPRGGKFDLTDDEGHIIEAGFDSEEAALQRGEAWQASQDRWAKQPGHGIPQHPARRLPESVTLDVPAGRSWFVTRPKGSGWEVEEHRVAPKVSGTESLSARDDVRMHQCASEGELTRRRRALADQGLFDRGVEVRLWEN